MDAKSIGVRIQEVRIRRGITQTGLAHKLNMTPKYVSNIECGAKIPKLETFIAIANALQIDANTLLSDELVVTPQLQSSVLWEKISKLSHTRRNRILQAMDLILEHEN